MMLSQPQAEKIVRKIDAVDHLTSSAEAAQPDSGICADLDSDFEYSIDKSLPSFGNSNEDWILYADENISQEDDYMFQEEDGVDIASVKANRGSYLNGTNNESFTSSLSYEGGRFVVHESPRHPEKPPHVFSNHPTTSETTTGTLRRWVRTHEQHEELAYYFEQSPSTVNCPHQFQQVRTWNETIDLSLYDINN